MIRRPWRRLALFAIMLLLLALVTGMLLLARSQGISLVHPDRSPPARTPADFGITDWQTIRLTAADGMEIGAWYIPPAAPDSPALVFVHGLGGNRAGLLDQAAMLVTHGYAALLIDLRNHGDSGGTMTTFGFSEWQDVRAAVDFLLTQPDVDAGRIGLVGESLGGATVIMAGARIPEAGAVIAQAAYSSLTDNVGDGVQRLTGLPAFPFAPLVVAFGEAEVGMSIGTVRPIDDIAAIAPRAILFIHGDQDDIINVRNSQQMFEAASEPKELFIIPGARHGGLYAAAPEEFEARVTAFLSQVLPASE